jgi:hypothetical protein
MKTKWSRILSTSLAALLVACAGPQATGVTEQPAAAKAAPVAPQADAEAILMGMAQFLSRTPRFGVKVRSAYDVVQASGEKIEFGEHRTLIVSRPDHLRVEVEQSDGDRNLVVFDGQTISVASHPRNVYAQASTPGDLDQAIRYFIRTLNMRLPLALLLVSDLPAELGRRVQSLDYVEKTDLPGVASHHLAGRTEAVDFQIWIAEGREPLPQRVVLTYKGSAGEPQFRADFSGWDLQPELTDALFAFTPPQGAQKIAFLPQLPALPAPKPGTADQTGGQR